MWPSDPTDWTISSVKSGHLRSVICGQPTSVLTGVVAIKAVAHKLARACYYVLRDQVPFDIKKAFVPQPA